MRTGDGKRGENLQKSRAALLSPPTLVNVLRLIDWKILETVSLCIDVWMA